MNKTFSEWLQAQLDARGMKPFHLAKAAGLNASTILNLLSGERQLGADSARAIAAALDLPQWEVFQAAGLITEAPKVGEKPIDPQLARIYRLVDKLAAKGDPSDLETLAKIIKAFEEGRGDSPPKTSSRRQATAENSNLLPLAR